MKKIGDLEHANEIIEKGHGDHKGMTWEKNHRERARKQNYRARKQQQNAKITTAQQPSIDQGRKN